MAAAETNQPAQHHSPREWTGRGKGSALGNRIFMALIQRFGLVPAYLLLVPVCFHYTLFDRQSVAAIRAFRRALGLTTTRYHLFRHFLSFGMSLVDRLGFLLRGHTPLSCTVSGREHFDRALGEGRGLMLVSAHVGNWELAGNLLGAGPEVPPINFLMLDAEREDLKRIFTRALDNRTAKIIAAGPDPLSVAFALKKALSAGEIVCMHGDRVIDTRHEMVPFLGHPARFPLGPFQLAARLNVPLIPIFTLRTSLRRYQVVVEPVLQMAAGESGPGTTPEAALETYVAALERIVRKHPYEWHNFYDFWNAPELHQVNPEGPQAAPR